MADAFDDGCACKVGRVIERRGLDELDRELAARWTEGEASLRNLAREFNLEVLETATKGAGMTPLDGEVENIYRLLTDDDVTSGMRRQCRDRLRRASVDPDAVTADFVSHQTVHSHFRDCLGVTRDRPDPDVDDESDRVRSLQTRLEAVTDDAVSRLADAGVVQVDNFDVYVDLAVVCRDCGERTGFGDLLADGGCQCRPGRRDSPE